MSPLRACFTLASLVGFALASAAGCGSNNNGTGGGGTGGGATTTTVTEDPTSVMCHACLASKCATQLTACGPDCYAIQACLDAVCANLSATGAATEGACQTYCQALHPAGKQQHLDLANCANMGPCTPPCAGAPYDYDQCSAVQEAATCAAASAACNGSSDCTSYHACVVSCATATDCENCSMGASGTAGRKLYEALTLCVDQSCFAEQWVPNL